MKLTFLGTAAAEGVPAVFCNCPTCVRAKALGGRNVRTRSQILIDDDTLFDFPMDTYMHMINGGLDLSRVNKVLITHAHMDHCYPQEFCMRGEPFARGIKEKNVEIFCNLSVRDIFLSDTSREIRPEIAKTIKITVIHPYDAVERDGTTIIALPANHTKGEECLVYYVKRGGAGVLLLNDTGVLDRELYEKLKDMGGSVNAAVFDCTYGAKRHGPGRHMGLYDIADQVEIIKGTGLFAKGYKVIATHFSHNTDLDYNGICEAAAPYDITVAYDGMTLNL